MDITKKNLSRRTVATGVAWTVPAVAVASAVPAFASSPVEHPEIELSDAKKHPGNSQPPCSKGYSFAATITGGNQDAVIEFTGAYFDNQKLDGVGFVVATDEVQEEGGYPVPAKSTLDVYILVNNLPNSANETGQFTLTYDVRYPDGTVVQMETGYYFNATPPGADCPI